MEWHVGSVDPVWGAGRDVRTDIDASSKVMGFAGTASRSAYSPRQIETPRGCRPACRTGRAGGGTDSAKRRCAPPPTAASRCHASCGARPSAGECGVLADPQIHMAFVPSLSPVGSIRTGLASPNTGRTEQLSTTARRPINLVISQPHPNSCGNLRAWGHSRGPAVQESDHRARIALDRRATRPRALLRAARARGHCRPHASGHQGPYSGPVDPRCQSASIRDLSRSEGVRVHPRPSGSVLIRVHP